MSADLNGFFVVLPSVEPPRLRSEQRLHVEPQVLSIFRLIANRAVASITDWPPNPLNPGRSVILQLDFSQGCRGAGY